MGLKRIEERWPDQCSVPWSGNRCMVEMWHSCSCYGLLLTIIRHDGGGGDQSGRWGQERKGGENERDERDEQDEQDEQDERARWKSVSFHGSPIEGPFRNVRSDRGVVVENRKQRKRT